LEIIVKRDLVEHFLDITNADWKAVKRVEMNEETISELTLIQVHLEKLYVYYELGGEEEAGAKAPYLVGKYQGKIDLLLGEDKLSHEGLAEKILIDEYMKKGNIAGESPHLFH